MLPLNRNRFQSHGEILRGRIHNVGGSQNGTLNYLLCTRFRDVALDLRDKNSHGSLTGRGVRCLFKSEHN